MKTEHIQPLTTNPNVKTEAAFTPGPWFPVRYGPEVGCDPFQWTVSCSIPDPIDVAIIGRAMTATEAEAEANARLIAAAPEMYEALVEAERCIEDAQQEFDCKWSGLHQVRAALARARGDAPSSKGLMDG